MKIRVFSIFFILCLFFTSMVFSRQPISSEPEAVQFAHLAALYSTAYWPSLERQASVFLTEFPDSSFTPRVRFMQGIAFFYLARYTQAVSLLEPLLTGESSAEAAYWLGRSYFELRRFEQSLEPLYKAASLFTAGSTPYCSALFYACRALIEIDEMAQAIPVLEYLAAAPETGENFFTVCTLLFVAYESQKQYENSISLYEKLDLAAFPPSLAEQIAYICAGAFALSGKYERALTVFEPFAASLQKEGTAAILKNDFLLRLAVRSFDQADYKSAREYFRRIEQNGASGSAALSLATLYEAEICLISEKNPQKALSLVAENLSSSGEYRLWFLTNAAKYAVLCGKYAQALEYSVQVETLIKKETTGSRNALSLYWHMRALFGLKEYASVCSLAAILPLSELEPDAARLYGLSLAAQGLYERSVPIFENLYTKTRLSDDALNLASAYLRSGNNAGAYAYASALSGQEAAYIAGLASFNLQNWVAAEKQLSSITQGEKLPYARYYAAVSLYRLEKFASSADSFATFIKDFPRSSLYWNASQTGTQAALQANRPEQALFFAENAYKTAVSQESKMQSALVLAGIHADSGKTAQAIALLKPLALGDTPSSLQCLFALGDLYAKTGDTTAADEAWNRLLQKNSSSQLAEDAAFRRAELFYETPEHEKTLERLSFYRKTWPRGRYADTALYFTAATLYAEGNANQAILLWQELATSFSKSTYLYNTLKNLAALYRENGEYQLALRTIEELLLKFGEQTRADGINKELEELKLLAVGLDTQAAALLASYERSGRDTTEDGRAIGIDLASYYLSNSGRRSEGIALIETALKKSSRNLGTERDTAARAALMLGNVRREEGKFDEAARLLLSAAEYYAPVDAEKTAQALYGAVESFDRTGSFAEVRSTLETMRSTVPDSVWTKRAESLIGGNQ